MPTQLLGHTPAFRVGLQERELEYVVQVKGTTPAQPADAALSPRPTTP